MIAAAVGFANKSEDKCICYPKSWKITSEFSDYASLLNPALPKQDSANVFVLVW